MLKTFLLSAFVANVVLTVSSTGTASCGGDKNAQSGCGNCPKTCKNYNSTEPQICTLQCNLNGCDCKKGYVLDQNTKKCVLPKDCTPTCGPNEVFDTCINGGCHTGRTCDQFKSLNGSTICVRPKVCQQGCLCKEGYYRNSKGICVPGNECPSTPCGGDENAESGCGNCPKTCQNYNSTEPIYCIQVCYENGCDCKKGFVLDENLKKCVRPENCTPTCGPDEVLNFCANGGCHSGRTCTQYENLNGATICVDPIKCKIGCLCKKGYYRNNDGVCVPANQCPKNCGGRSNEQYVPCPDECIPQKCSQLGYPIACPAISEDGSCPSKPGCICDDGFVRDDQGICIPVEQCSSCGGDENAQKGCANCPTTCKNYNNTEPRICPQYCEVNGCDCKQGFVLDENLKKCVRSEDCTATCGPDEVFDTCANGGCHSGRTCTQYQNLNGSIICVDPSKCEPGCLCKEGYYRNNDGVCVPASECPTSCGGDENAQKGCANCPTTCKNYNNTKPKICPRFCKVNGCDCKQGFVLDENLKKCVRSEDCTATCGPDEVFDTCANGGCHSGRTCTQYQNLNGSIICVDPSKCEPGCLCKEGYYRNNDGVCVPASECPTSCGGDENAESGCGNCPKTCQNYNSTDPIFCTEICYENACDCKEGFVLDENLKICVRPENCTATCGPDEAFDTCANGGCHNGRTCTQYINFNGSTICVDPVSCEPGCLCKEGYYRNNDGVCVPANECPTSCGGDENAESGCGNCPKTCQNYNSTEPIFCIQICYENACDCKEGFLLDGNLKKCVRPENCTATCGPDEVFDTCANGGCHSGRTCTQYGILNGTIICEDPAKCEPGCLCKEGYYRNNDGVCVPANECSSSCGPNEVYDTCVNGRCHGPETCKDLDNNNGSTICDYAIECQSGCLCKDGYLRNHKGVCIPENKCPNSKCKGNFETYVPCNYQCTPETCDQLGFSRPCLLPAPGPSCSGKSACLCRAGYLRNRKGKCIPIDQCPSCGGDPNAKPGCGVHCGRSCSDYFRAPVACPAICLLNGCDCKDKYVFDRNIGKCVLPEKCTPICGQYEKYTTCKENSIERRCGQPPRLPPFVKSLRPRHCTAGCVCQDGYYRNSNGVCVTKDRCNDQCGKNEVFDKCLTTCPPRKCGINDAAVLCAPTNPADCKAGCRCQDGYYRNNQGECVTWEMCPPICNGENEISDPCPDSCDPNTCESIDKKYNCPLKSTDVKQCKPACRCKPGFYRNKVGQCISKENCLKCTKPHEYYSCGGACDNVCSTLSQQNQTYCPIINIKCNEMCYCEEGYARDRQGNCVPISTCRSCKGEHEWYDKCTPNCPPSDSCDTYGKVYSCPAQSVPPNCTAASCRCEDNYLRDKNGTCIRQEQCPCNGDPNAKPGCGCSKTCPDFYAEKPPTCTKICKINACDCKDNYVLDVTTGKCVLPENCPPICPKGESYHLCPNPCPPELCSVDETVIRCKAPPKLGDPECKPGCRCPNGYKRDVKGVCIPKEQCPPQCPKHEKFDLCPATCPPETCPDGRLYKCPAPLKPGSPGCPKPRCRCEAGYYRNDTGICIPKEQCPPICPKGELYDPCPNPCPPQLCSVDERVIRCIAPPKLGDPECKPGCRCPDGYKRDVNGVCIPKEQCPQFCYGENEISDPCPDPCDPNTCESIGKKYNCPLKSTDVKQCKPACRCKPGFYRNKIGQCTSKQNCLKCTKPHEFFSCGGACDNVCSTLSQQNQTYCPIINIKCNEMCYCEEGYARDRQGNCVPISTCRSCKGEHEWYDKCTPNCPPSDSCDTYGKVYSCPAQSVPLNCTAASCRCEDNYLRDKNGTCIRQEQCPCNGDPNAKPGCGCSKTCSDFYAEKPPICTKICKVNACDCKDNYVRDETTGKCVLPENCPPQCPKHEKFDLCPATCPPETCPDGRLYKCPAPLKPGSPGCPKPRCRCEAGYYRNDTGICIPKEQCPPICPKGELYDPCPNPCPPQLCSVDERVIRCIAPPKLGDPECKPGCRCPDGYKRDVNGVCIPKEQCPPFCYGENEISDPCPDPCDPNTCESIDKKYNCPLKSTDVKQCKPACRCKPGFYRNKLGLCISKENCLKCTKPHEYYSCGGACDNVCSTLSQQNQTNCPIINIKCNEMCYCEEGYARDRQGNCVPISTCRSCKGEHEWYDKCTPNCPPSDSCDTYGKRYSCPNQSVPPKCTVSSCRCEDNYLRDKNGTCIRQEQCPCNGDPNAKPGCGCSKTCSDFYAGKPPTCTKICKINACDCKDNYVRDEKSGKCVLPENCPSQCPKHEEFDLCPATCPPETCPDGHVYFCPLSPKPGSPGCKPRCRCEAGYYRNDTGICVSKDQCPPYPSQCAITQPDTSPSDNDAYLALSRGINIFAFQFFKQVYRIKSGENIFMSPYSAQVPIAQLALRAEDNTLKQQLAALNLSNKDQIREAFPRFSKALQGTDGVTLDTAIAIYLNQLFAVNESYANETLQTFNGTIENINCADPPGTAKHINDWVASKTNNRIQNLIPENVISPDTRLIMVNAIYFQSKWEKEFNKNKTKLQDFYTSDNRTVQVKTMNMETALPYTNDDCLGAQVVQLPYVNNNYSCVVVLPRTRDGLAQTVANLNANTMTAALNKLTKTKVKLALPTMEINTSLDLVDIFKALGLTDMCDPNKANFQGILNTYAPLSVTGGVQKAFFKCKEEGSEAAAATGIVVGTTAVAFPPPVIPEVICDHPFLFVIFANKNTPIFIGSYQGSQ